MSLGGWGWAFRVYRLNSREAARRPLRFDILKRAKRCRPKKKMVALCSITHTDQISKQGFISLFYYEDRYLRRYYQGIFCMYVALLCNNNIIFITY